MRQFATDEGMGLDLSLSVTSLTLTPGREERGGARGGGVQEDEAAGPAGRHAVEATLVVQHARSPKHAPPPRVRARRSGRRNVGGRDVAPPPAAGRVLDGFAVVEACGVELPELVQSVNLMGKGFTDCEVNDMPHFVELQTLDVGDNELPGLHCFAALPSLRQLKMQCNSLLTAYAPPGAFLCLDTLELAFNSLDARALAQLAALPMLRELDLSSNCITSVSDDPFDGTEEPFPALETLHLGSQSPKLSPQALFAFAKLPELRTLRVPDNKIRGMDPAWLPEGGFPVLGLVDLSDNLIEIEDAITVFLAVPPLDKVVLWGNPLATFAPREVGAQVPFVGSQQAFLLLQRPPPPTKPRLNQLYADPVVLDEELPPKPMPFQMEGVVATMDGVGAMAEAMAEEMGVRSASPEPEGDSFFLTGGGREHQEYHGPELDEEFMLAEEEAFFAEETARMDAAAAAMRSPGRAQRSPAAALAALKFALDHPLVDNEDVGEAPTHHLQSTASMRAKERTRRQTQKLSAAATAELAKAEAIQTNEAILATMKDRLSKVEENLRTLAASF